MDWQTLYDYLVDNGYSVYPPGTHEGDCDSPYLILTLAGTSPVYGISTDDDLYEILVYYPYGWYSTMEGFQKSLKRTMAKFAPVVHIVEDFGFVYHDDDVKAYMTSINYGCYKRRELF